MEAKDTAMSWDKIVKLTGFVSDVDSHPAKRMRELSKKQAEISFKIGKTEGVAESLLPALKAIEKSRKAGQREMVEWIEKHALREKAILGDNRILLAADWEDQLKEWGISDV